MGAIKARPTEGLCYQPSDKRYWDKAGLDAEIERVFDICHGCRLCFKLCPSFPALFDAVDRHDGDVRKLGEAEIEGVVDACFQCKLCYAKCPYTADDGHEFDLDFPALLMRYTAQRTKRKGLGLREKMLGNPSALGKLAAPLAPLANWGNRNKLSRVMMERTIGIHRDKKLPDFHRETFEVWAKRRAPGALGRSAASGVEASPGSGSGQERSRGAEQASTAASAREVVLFHTCFVNYNNPQLGKDAVAVLERNGVRVLSPSQNCCGMPALDGGDVEFAQRQARENIRVLKPYVDRGLKVLAINPTCSLMLKREYVGLVGEDMREDAKRLAAATRDLMEYVSELQREGALDESFASSPGEVAYHVPCHLKAQNIGFRSRDVMKKIPGAKVRVVDGCCGHDGTWAMKKEHFEASLAQGKPVFEQMSAGGLMATDCPLAAIQFEQATGQRPIHPVQVLARAYEAGGFGGSRSAVGAGAPNEPTTGSSGANPAPGGSARSSSEERES